MKRKHLLATLVVGVVAMTTAACSDLIGGEGGPEVTSPTSRPAPKPATGDQKLSQRQLIAKVKPSVVRITGSRSFGSGVVVDDDRGLVLTNAHVTFGQQAMRARVGDDLGSETAVRLVATAPCEDLAVVQLVNRPANLRAIRLGNSSKLRPGDHVTALGYPTSLQEQQGDDATTQAAQVLPTDGNVSAVNVAAAGGPSFPRLASTIVHQADISPGNSGGPLVDDWGRLVGINTLYNREAQGQFYSIGVNRVRQILPNLKAGQSQANLGWKLVSLATADLPTIFDADPDLAAQGGAELGQRVLDHLAQQEIEGLYVQATERASAVREVSIHHGNLVTAIDSQPVRRVQDVCDLVLSKRPGDTMEVTGYFLYTPEAATSLQPWTVDVEVR